MDVEELLENLKAVAKPDDAVAMKAYMKNKFEFLGVKTPVRRKLAKAFFKQQTDSEAFPAYSWELKNQVYMHIHSPNSQPYTSSKDAMSKYPECCTAIGLRLLEDDKLELFAPYGLADIRAFQVRPTPHFLVDAERKKLYMQRIRKKNWQAKWPQLSFETLSEEK